LKAHGYPPLSYFLSCFFGHSLGNLTFTPLALLVIGRTRLRRTWKAWKRHRRDLAVLLPLLIAATLAVFWQSRLPLLFLPILPVMLIAFRAGREGTVLSIAVLAVLGGAMTAAGLGQAGLIGGSLGYRLLFFQFYLATTVLTVLPVAADMQQRRVLHRRVRDSEARFRLMAEYSTDIIMTLHKHGRIAYISPAIRQFGYTEQELIGRNCAMLIDPEHLEETADAHLRTFEVGEATNRFEYLAVAKDGSRHWCEAHARMIVNERGGFDAMLSMVRNIDERKRNEERPTEAALTDSLTGLPNRRAFREAAQTEFLRNGREQGTCIALFDIDYFKRVNDRYGHDAGDEVLRVFARVAMSQVRKNDLVSRLGGEEFAVIFPDTSTAQALIICDRLRVEIANTVTVVGNRPIRVTVSGGVSVLGEEGIDEALKQADLALYHAKNGGRDQLALAA
jgi:diguanylate cyclase (GGDEF)-like protein/PAS domain S-box-containing protein